MRFKDIKFLITRALKGMVPRSSSDRAQTSVELPWGGDKLRFDSLGDFEFALNARTGVLPARLHELTQRSASELETEQQGILNLSQRIATIVDANASSRLPCAPALAQLGVSVFSKDFEWRSLFAHLLELPPSGDRYVRAALDKYQQYLSARLTTVRLVAGMKVQSAGTEEKEDGHAKATVMFETDGALRPFSRDELRRLPQGDSVTLRLARGSAISLKLARHRFSLTHNREWMLVADNGKSYTLHEGVNCVGRGRDNDVSLDADFRNVSRKHLLAQPLDDDVILLTDISSHGTYVPPTALAS